MLFYTYWRSTAAYRVRIALNYKKIPHTPIAINLNEKEQLHESYRLQNPQTRVPSIYTGTTRFGQSAAILEYLEEKYPKTPPLLPKDVEDRAWVRYLSQIVISDMHPIMNRSSVLTYFQARHQFTDENIQEWLHHWLKQGFDALETIIADNPKAGTCCFGHTPTIADVCLIPQVYNAHQFDFSMQPYPTLQRIYENCNQLEAFKDAAPENQFDYVKEPTQKLSS